MCKPVSCSLLLKQASPTTLFSGSSLQYHLYTTRNNNVKIFCFYEHFLALLTCARDGALSCKQ